MIFSLIVSSMLIDVYLKDRQIDRGINKSEVADLFFAL
jgi:hypothetical protein